MNKNTVSETWFSEVIQEGKTLAKQEELLKIFKKYPLHKKYNFFNCDLPYSYPEFHGSVIPYKSVSVTQLKKIPILT